MAYKNRLGLTGIPRIEELRPQRLGFFSSGKDDEFVSIADSLENWQLERKSLADFVQDETHKKALIDDLVQLKRKAEKDIITEEKRPTDEQVPDLILRRRTFIKIAESEITRLQGWKPVSKEEAPINFREFNAKAICVLSTEGARKFAISATVYIHEEGEFIIKQEMIETNQRRELERVMVTKASLGKPIQVSLDTNGTSRLALYEQKTGREESRPL